MDEVDREIQDRISRRRMIKRLGAATAVAWTAPVLSTLGAPAYAQDQSPQPLNCPDCVAITQPGNAHCTGQTDCVDTPAEPSGNPCSCLRTAENTCECHSCVFCDNPAIVQCTASSQCPAGWICASSCCSDPLAVDFACQPRCGGGDNPDPCVGLQGAARNGRLTSMG